MIMDYVQEFKNKYIQLIEFLSTELVNISSFNSLVTSSSDIPFLKF